jgi:hypothetical protein
VVVAMIDLRSNPNLWDMPALLHDPVLMLAPHRDWIAELSNIERTIFLTAFALYHVLDVAGGCYHNSFFLHYFLKKRFHINGHVEVGFIHDGTGDSYASHAWYVYKGNITDLAVSRPYNPSQNRIGPVIILGREILGGWPWTYYPESTTTGTHAKAKLLNCGADDQNGLARIAQSTHIEMSKTAESSANIRAYLDRCPQGMTYHDLVEKIALWQATTQL